MRNLRDDYNSNSYKSHSLKKLNDKFEVIIESRENLHLYCNNNQEILLHQGDYELILPYLKRILSSIHSKEFKIQLPNRICPQTLDLYISLLRRKSFHSSDIFECFNLLSLSEYFKDEKSNLIIKEKLIHLIENNNCLEVLKEFEEKKKYIDIVQICIENAYKNIFYLINNKNEKLLSLNNEIIEEIFERYFDNSIFKLKEDYSQIINLMIKYRNLPDIFELLENERKRAITIFGKSLNYNNYKPFLIWKVHCDNPNQGYYKESEPFYFDHLENYEFVIINYYNYENDTFNIAIKIFNEKGESDTTINLPILSMIKIKELNFSSNINFNCMVLDTKSKVLLSKIEKFSSFFVKKGFNKIEYTLEIFFNISSNFSAILSHICRNFYQFYSLPSIVKISKNVINIIIKSSCLIVKNEEEKISAIKNWNRKKEEKINSGEELYRSINWEKISLDGILEFIINDSSILLQSDKLQRVLVKEFQNRFRNEQCNNRVKQSVHNKSGNSSLIEENNLSFTYELISKLIKMASNYENSSKFTNKSVKPAEFNNISIKNEETNQFENKFKIFSDNNLSISNYSINLIGTKIKENKSKINTLNDLSFIENHYHHKRNLSNSNELLNETFKNLSNNLSNSFSKFFNKSHNISPNKNLMNQSSINYQNKKINPKPTIENKVLQTTQTNVISTNNYSNIVTENKYTNQSTKVSKTKHSFKTSKIANNLKKKNDNTKDNLLSDMFFYVKPNYLKNGIQNEKITPDQIKHKNSNNDVSRPKSLSLYKKKAFITSAINKKIVK